MATAYGRVDEYQEGEHWDDYIERLDQYCLANDIADSEAVKRKRALFLSVVGSKTYGLIKTLLAPEAPTTKSYTELCTLVKEHVNPKPIVIAERYKFYNRKQKSGESVSQYVRELRKLAETCAFGIALSEALRDMFVIGLNDKSAQRKLLSQADLTLKKAFDTALGQEMANLRVEEIHGHGHGQAEVKKVSMNMNNMNNKGKECFRCGKQNHSQERCFYKDAVCHQCHQKGHLSRKCPNWKEGQRPTEGKTMGKKASGYVYGKRKINKRESKVKHTSDRQYHSDSSDNSSDYEDSDQELSRTMSVMYVRNVSQGKYSEILVDVKLNGQAIKMEVDTGAGVSLINKKLYKKLLQDQVPIKPTDMVLKTITGASVPVEGICMVDVTYGEQEYRQLPLYIVKSEGPALFGREWMKQIKLNWKKIHSVREEYTSNSEHPGVEKLMQDYKEVDKADLGKVVKMEARLRIKDGAQPIFFKPRPVPFALKEGITRELNRLEASGVIEKIEYSDWAAPIVPVRKPNGDIRICGDFKVTINPYLDNPEHPIPSADELYQRLNGGKKFTKLDLSQAYQQLPLHPESRKYVTVNTQNGLYAYKRMPYGISAAPQIFQAVMDKVLQGIECGCFLDDIIVTGKDDKEHLANLEGVLGRLQKYGFRCNVKKCDFMKPALKYLSFIVDAEGIHMDKTTIEAVKAAPRPTCVKEMQSFLGLVNHYRRYAPNLSTIASPLHELLKKEKQWCWSTDCERAFKDIKRILTTEAGVLVHYDPSKPLSLAVDASPIGLGAVISHTKGGKEERPIAFASRSLTPPEKNYSQLEKEGLAIIFGLQKFHQYLFARKFTLITDNKPLSFILGPKKGIPVLAASRIQRWAIQLAAYKYDIQVRGSKENGNADALSRLPLPTMEQNDGERAQVNWTAEATLFNVMQVNQLPVTAKEISLATSHDPTLAKVMHFTINGWPDKKGLDLQLQPYVTRQNELSLEEGCLLWGARTIIPPKFRSQLLQDLHNDHPGMVRMKALARLHVWWPNLNQEIERTVRECKICQETQPKAPQAEANPWRWPTLP